MYRSLTAISLQWQDTHLCHAALLICTCTAHLRCAAGVPEFWLTAMKNNEILAEQVSAPESDKVAYASTVMLAACVWSQSIQSSDVSLQRQALTACGRGCVCWLHLFAVLCSPCLFRPAVLPFLLSPGQITVRDEGCLKYLKDITWSHLGEGTR